MSEQLTIQTFVDGDWYDALVMTVASPEVVENSRCSTAYVDDYLYTFVDQVNSPFEASVSVRQRLNWGTVDGKGYPPFVLDIIPAGAAKKSLKRRFEGEKPEGVELDLFLLKRCTPAPIGHMRVKESFEQLDSSRPVAFPRNDVIQRTNTFLEYAYEQGAAIGGATGAQGEAPKLLMSEDQDGGLHADAMLPDTEARKHWLIKFARNQVTERDKNILRAEYQYYRAIAELGLDTVSTDGLILEEAEKPSLWMPRFDRRVHLDGTVERIPMESVYSVCGNTVPGSYMEHDFVIRNLIELWTENKQFDDLEEMVFEYIRRDLLNRILGNSDNHGRNTSIFRYQGRFKLAPIYDLAPMVLDQEGITRVTKWQSEKLGAPDWAAVCASFSRQMDSYHLFGRLKTAAQDFRALPGLLKDLPDEILKAQSIPLNNLDRCLKEWGLL